MVGFRSVRWTVTALLLFTVATSLGIVNGRLLIDVDYDDRIEMVTASPNAVRKEEEGSTRASLGDLHPLCAFCKTAVNDFQVQINRPDAVDVAVQSFEKFVCGKLQAEGIREKCKEVGEIYIPALIDVLREDVTEDKVCGALKLCDEDDDTYLSSFSLSRIFTSPDHPHPPHPHPHHHHHHHHHHHFHHLFQLFRRHHPQRKCKICQAFAAQALRYLSQNETVEEIVAIAHKACKRLKGETTQEECDSLVDVYSEDLPSIMASVTPEELCHFVKFCEADVDAVAAHDAAVADAAEREGESGEEEEEEDGNAFGRHGGNECLLCRFAVIKARKRLENPEVQEMIMGVLDRTCERVPKHTDQCKAFLESYGENFFENLDVILDPHGFCRRVGACFSSSM